MPKVKLSPDPIRPESEDWIGPLPKDRNDMMDGPGEEGSGDGSSSPSTGSAEPDPGTVKLCGQVIALPFELWHSANPVVDPLSDEEDKRLAEPLAEILERYGWAKYLGKAELRLLLNGFVICYARFAAVAEDKRKRSEQEELQSKHAADQDGRPAA